VHQFVRVGRQSIIGGCSKVVQDVPPYSTCDGHPAKVYSINSIGLKRSGMPKESINQLKASFKLLFHSGLSLPTAIKKIKVKFPSPCDELKHLISFVSSSKRGLSR
jgi:UDP-N-acetylglucosamine acyltransferase